MKESDIIKKILCIIIILITLIIPFNTKAQTDIIQKEKKDAVEIILTGTIILTSILYIYKKKQIKL